MSQKLISKMMSGKVVYSDKALKSITIEQAEAKKPISFIEKQVSSDLML